MIVHIFFSLYDSPEIINQAVYCAFVIGLDRMNDYAEFPGKPPLGLRSVLKCGSSQLPDEKSMRLQVVLRPDFMTAMISRLRTLSATGLALGSAASVFLIGCWSITVAAEEDQRSWQYEHEDILIEEAREDEPKLDRFSATKALTYLDNGATAWSRSRSCIACHTNGSYLRMRPLLTKSAGKPLEELHAFFVSELERFEEQAGEDFPSVLKSVKPIQIVYIAMGLAEWDAQVSGHLSGETRRALDLMFAVQSDSGAWGYGIDCWPPFESSPYQMTTVAAMAAATAPGWRKNVTEQKHITGLAKIRQWLSDTPPPHDYGKTLLLWASTRWPQLLDESRSKKIVDELLQRQQPDGGWSIRSFARPEEWGDGRRAEKLRGEVDFDSPPSDGHMTGLVMITLLDAGVPTEDPRIQQGVEWVKNNQRKSGRWWTRSLNTDKFHFITFSSTLYCLVALDKSGALMP